MKMSQMQSRNLFPNATGALNRFAYWAVGRAPTDYQDVAFAVSKNGRKRNLFCKLSQLMPSLCGHCVVYRATSCKMSHFVMLESGNNRILAFEHSRSRWRMMRDLIKGVLLIAVRTWAQIRLRILHQRFQIRLIKCFDPRC